MSGNVRDVRERASDCSNLNRDLDRDLISAALPAYEAVREEALRARRV